MITFFRSLHGQNQEITLWTEEEARSKGLQRIPWREAFDNADVRVGDWAISDDGLCAQILQIRPGFIRTTAAYLSKAHRDKPKGTIGCFNARSRIRNRAWNRFGDQGIRQRILGSRRVRSALRYIAMSRILHKQHDLELAGRMAFPHDKKPLWGMTRILAWEETQVMIKNLGKEILYGKNFKEEKVIEMILEAADIAREKKDPKALLAVADRLSEFLEIAPKKAAALNPYSEYIPLPSPDELDARIASEQAKLSPHLENELNPEMPEEGEAMLGEADGSDYVNPKEYVSELARNQSRS